MSIFLKRVKEYAKAKDLSLRAISIAAGQSDSYLSNSIKQGSVPSAEIISNIIDNYPDLNPYWLLTGRGEMLIHNDGNSENLKDFTEKKTIDELIDEKIDAKLKALGEGIRELIISEIEDELEQTRKEIKNSKNGHLN